MKDKVTRGKLNLTTNREHWIYLAGILDADGSICISKATAESLKLGRCHNPRYVLYLNIVNTSKELMDWLIQNFGGTNYKRRKRLSDNHRVTYDWRLSNNQCIEVLKLIEPFLIIKKDRAKLGIEFVEGMPERPRGQGAKTQANEVLRREALWNKMKELNQFGDTAATTKSSGPLRSKGDAIV